LQLDEMKRLQQMKHGGPCALTVGNRPETSALDDRAMRSSSSSFRFSLLARMAIVSGAALGACAHADCPDPLFVCESTQPDKYIQICATEVEVGKRWTGIQYRFGLEHAPEFVFPADSEQGASRLLFSHEVRGKDYRVSVRFATGPYVYRVYSSSGGQGAGVTVSDRTGKTLSNVRCAERPTMFAPYMQQALACDLANPHGRAACQEKPYRLK
jgi:hypothetical protein